MNISNMTESEDSKWLESLDMDPMNTGSNNQKIVPMINTTDTDDNSEFNGQVKFP